MKVEELVNRLNPYKNGVANENWRRGFLGEAFIGTKGSPAEEWYRQGRNAGRQVANINPPRGRNKNKKSNFIYTLVVERDGKVEEEVDLYEPFEPVEQIYVMDSQTLEDALLMGGWKPVNIDVYTRINDRYGFIVIRAEANKLPNLGPYKIYVREEPANPPDQAKQ